MSEPPFSGVVFRDFLVFSKFFYTLYLVGFMDISKISGKSNLEIVSRSALFRSFGLHPGSAAAGWGVLVPRWRHRAELLLQAGWNLPASSQLGVVRCFPSSPGKKGNFACRRSPLCPFCFSRHYVESSFVSLLLLARELKREKKTNYIGSFFRSTFFPTPVLDDDLKRFIRGAHQHVKSEFKGFGGVSLVTLVPAVAGYFLERRWVCLFPEDFTLPEAGPNETRLVVSNPPESVISDAVSTAFTYPSNYFRGDPKEVVDTVARVSALGVRTYNKFGRLHANSYRINVNAAPAPALAPGELLGIPDKILPKIRLVRKNSDQ